MLTEEQIKLADLFIKHISTINYERDENYVIYFERTNQATQSQLIEIRKLLFDNGLLIKLYKSDFTVKLSLNGQKALSIGIERYFKELEDEAKIDTTLKTATIENYKFTKKLSIVAIICSIIIPILVVIIDKQINTPEKESNYYRNYRQAIADSIISQVLTDSVFIEKTKNSIKHDTLFLNELKETIKHEMKITTP